MAGCCEDVGSYVFVDGPTRPVLVKGDHLANTYSLGERVLLKGPPDRALGPVKGPARPVLLKGQGLAP